MDLIINLKVIHKTIFGYIVIHIFLGAGALLPTITIVPISILSREHIFTLLGILYFIGPWAVYSNASFWLPIFLGYAIDYAIDYSIGYSIGYAMSANWSFV